MVILHEQIPWALVAWTALAGLVRGFAGFGGALIFVPAASALVGPRIAVIALWLLDTLPTLPIILPALRKWSWRSVIPVAIGSGLTVGFGARLLAVADPVTLRWAMSALVVVLVCILASGIRYSQTPRFRVSFSVGIISGLLSGATQLTGPPVVAFWLGGPDRAEQVRANLIIFFAISTIASGIAFWAHGLFSKSALVTAAVAAPVFMIALAVGQKGFRRSSEALFRRIAYGLILLSAIAAVPIFDRN